jgi:hypothetical protein
MRKIRELNKLLKAGKKPVASKPASDTTYVERRSGPADRRTIPTFIADDRRSGIADRRKNDKTGAQKRCNDIIMSF